MGAARYDEFSRHGESVGCGRYPPGWPVHFDTTKERNAMTTWTTCPCKRVRSAAAISFAFIAAIAVSLPGCTSNRHAADLAALRAENEMLRKQVQDETGRQMRDIVVKAITHYYAEHDRLPMRHSELRSVVGDHGWTAFIAPYDRVPERVNEIAQLDNPWAWIDENASYEWLEGEVFDSYSPIFFERGEAIGQQRWVVFGDCHAELIAYGGAAWRELGLP